MRVSINDIQDNMIIDENVYNDEGRLIISRGLSVSDSQKIKDLLLKNNKEKIKVLVLREMTYEEKSGYNYEEEKQKEIKTFINDFNSNVNSFKSEIQNTLSGQGNLSNLENILKEAINTNTDKNTNVFQLLQKLKNSNDLIFTHCNAVSLTAYAIGSWIKLPEKTLRDLSLAGLLFDIGKYYIPKEILIKEEALTNEEFEIVKTHIDKSIEILKDYDLNDDIIKAIKFHHEMCDGSGYYGLKGEQIPIMSKILALSDIFVALTSKRPYREKFTPFEAIKILETNYMQKLDIVILSEFVKRIASNYIGNAVMLSNGLKGEIFFINANAPLRPIIKLKPSEELLDLSAKNNSDIYIKEFI